MVYLVEYETHSGVNLKYRVSAQNKREARKVGREVIGCKAKDIVAVYKEVPYEL